MLGDEINYWYGCIIRNFLEIRLEEGLINIPVDGMVSMNG